MLHEHERITLHLTPGEAQQLIDDLCRLDAYVIARSGSGIEPSKRRREIRRRLKAILDARQGAHSIESLKRHRDQVDEAYNRMFGE